MKHSMHYVIMGGVFAVLFTLATLGLELLEGNKITTTAYYGLRNLGWTFILFSFFASFLFYPISFLPLTFIINTFVRSLLVKVIIYSFIGGISGRWVFNLLFGFEEGHLISGYDLNIRSAVIVFTIAGLIYALVDHNLKNKLSVRNSGSY